MLDWCQDILDDFLQFYHQSLQLPALMTTPASLLVRRVKECMLLIEPTQRMPARECLDSDIYSPLWSWSSEWEVKNNAVQAESSTQGLQSPSFEANSLQSSRFDDTDDQTFENVSGFGNEGNDDEGNDDKGNDDEGNDDEGNDDEATQNDAGLFNTPHPIISANGNVKRKRGSRTSSTSTKDKAEKQTTSPDTTTPDKPENPTAGSNPQHGSDDSAITVRAVRSSAREHKRTKFASI